MKDRIAVLTKDDNLYEKIYLMYYETKEVERTVDESSYYTHILVDTDTYGDYPSADIRMSREYEFGNNTLPIPFKYSELEALLDKSCATCRLQIADTGRAAVLDGETIKLTEVELKLLRTLYDTDGYISRRSLIEQVWRDESDEGVLNVYIYYLRQKLEKNGEKIILSSRKLGYCIADSFKRGDRRENA